MISREARRYIVWATCQKHGWDLRAQELVDILRDERPSEVWSLSIINNTISTAGWKGRLTSWAEETPQRMKRVRHLGNARAGRNFDENLMGVDDIMRMTT